MRTFLRGKMTLLFITCAVVLAIPAIALADIVADSINDVSTSVGSRTIVAGDSIRGGYNIQHQNTGAGDTQNSCNPADGTAANLAFNVTDVTATPNPLVISACSNTFSNATFSSEKAGTYSITPAVSDAGGGVYQTAPATWSLTVNKAKTQLTNVNGAGISGQSSGSHVQATLSSFKTDGTTVNKNLQGKTVTFKIDGNTVGTDVTDANGLAELNNFSLSGVSAGSHTLTAEFAGDDGYLTSTGTGPMGVAPPPDSTGPVITKVVTGTQGNNGWYTSNVGVDWTVSDPESAISSQSGCADFSVTSDQNATTYTCTATSGGGTSSDSVTIKRDATNPTITASVDRAANANGWYNDDVTVSFNCSDSSTPGSGLAAGACPADVVLGEGANQSVTRSVTDQAGNSASDTVSDIDIDKTAPSVTVSLSRAADHNGWYNHSVGYGVSAKNDTLSGIASCQADATYSGPDDANASVSRTCTDNAGNTGSDSESFQYDATAPVITDAGRKTQPNADGWYASQAFNKFTASDSPSGLADSTKANFEVGTGTQEGSGLTVASGTVSDNAGNTAASKTSTATFNVDLSNPYNVAFVGGPGAGSSYDFGPGNVPAAPTCTATDDVSGLKSCVVSGYSTAVGSHTMTATATDKAGHTATATRSYTVKAANASGFYQPVDMGGYLNTVKSGSTVPVKFELFGGFTNTEQKTLGAVSSMTANKVSCAQFTGDPVDQIEYLAPTSENTGLRFDTTGDQFIYNWKTPAKAANTCYSVTMTAQDTQTKLVAYFKLT